MTYAGYTQTGGAILKGGFCRGVLRNATGETLWTCEHTHVTRDGAVSCAYQAEGIAKAGGWLPATEPVQWDDPETWPRSLRKVRSIR